MTITIDRKTLICLLLLPVVFILGLGAGSPTESPAPRWAMCSVSDTKGSVYVLNQHSGNLYYFERKQSVGSKNKFKIDQVGNVRGAK